MSQFTESVVEEAALEWFAELGYHVVHGPDIARELVETVRKNVSLLSDCWTEATA